MKTIFVMSNKGGVGKTTIAVNLAYLLSEKYKVGLLDVDIHGPNAPKMLGVSETHAESSNEKIVPIRVNENLYMMSIAFLTEKQNEAVIWRGPLKSKLIMQFVNDVSWPDLDFLIVDLPPGTGDETITIMQLLKENSGAIIVSTPQEVSIMDAKKAINLCKNFNVEILGLIENMSGEIFGKGKVKELAQKENVKFLGSLGMSKEINNFSNAGKPFVSDKNLAATKEFKEIVKNLGFLDSPL